MRNSLGYHVRRLPLALCVVLGLVAPLEAQTYSLAPPPYQTVLNNAGDKVSNACVWTYAAGTTTPIATYSDSAGTVNQNPIRTDSAGRFTAYLTPGTGYKFTYELPCTPPAHGSVLRTADNVVGTPIASVVTSGTWIPNLGGTATYTARTGYYVRVGALVFVTANLQVATIGTGSPSQITGLPFPALGDAAGSVGYFTALALSVYSLNMLIQTGGTSITLGGLTVASGAIGFPANVIGNGTILIFSASYVTAAP